MTAIEEPTGAPTRDVRIRSCRTGYSRIPREEWWPLALGDLTHQVSHAEIITCEVTTASGVTGFGYSYTLGHGGVGVHAILAEEVAPELAGLDCRGTVDLWQRLFWKLHWVGRAGVVPVAMAAADIAIWDALAKEAELPLYRYLGACREEIRAYGSGVDLAYTIDELVQEVAEYRAAGFSAVKVKVGQSLTNDLERLQAVREAIGDDCDLMVDANMGWSVAEGARRARIMEQFDLGWLEEPLVPEDVDGHSELQRQTSIPIAAGETLFSPYEFKNYLRHDAIRIAQPDVTRLGGITGFLEVARMAEAFHVPIAPHFMQDVHIHLVCASPNAMILEYLPWLDALLEEPLRVEAGVARPSQRPGHGVRFRADVLERYRLAESRVG